MRGGSASLVVAYILFVDKVIPSGDDFGERAILPTRLDFAVGVVFIALLLEATRRATGWIMPVVALVFIAYALVGKHLPAPWTHKGYDFDRLIGHLYMTLEGVYGTTVDVSSTPDHPVHDLRRGAAVFGRGQILHRLLVRGHGREEEQRRPRGRAVVVPDGRAVRFGRRDDRHDRHRRLSDAEEGRL